MSVITIEKPQREVLEQLMSRGDLHTLVVGCDKCAKTCQTGGAEQARRWKDRIKATMMLAEPSGMADALEEGLCSPDAVRGYLKPLDAFDHDVQVLVLACGAGLKCIHDILPSTRIVPGLNTLAGVKAELACLACGDCRFDEGGCRMLALRRIQKDRLEQSYGASSGNRQ